MANYEEYSKRGLEGEIQEAQQGQQQRQAVPDSVRQRFDGKNVDDVLTSFASLEQRLGQQGQELGELRRQNQMLMEAALSGQTSPQEADTTESVPPITVDDLYNDPSAAIAKVVEAKTRSQLQKMEHELAAERMARAKAELSAKFDGWENEVQSDEFRNWVTDSAFRSRVAADADRGDLTAANDLLSEWYRSKETNSTQELDMQRQRQFNDAALETSSPVGMAPEETYSRAELQQVRMAAKRGDWEAQQWLDTNADAIRLAYEEERVI